MIENFSADKPISFQKEDKFQRYPFAKRIANVISERLNEECIVIGIYGAWGEGKTSVINFIETELKKNDNIIPLKFNPWRFSEESSLLQELFQNLANALDTNLKTKAERIGDSLKKYGKLLNFDIPVVGKVGDLIESTGELISEVSIEDLKQRIGTSLLKSKSKIVVFIDDIDRLDKNEIHSIFRLVKLTADFSNTIYILSFDEGMVASAIGERFGEGNNRAGENFLEKIIQVPLKIPVAQQGALKDYFIESINNVLKSNSISLSEEEMERFSNQFSTNILIAVKTPRLIHRYTNSISFSIPLLNGEVNMVDLMLIEAVKVFYPEYYNFIKSNTEYFFRPRQRPQSRLDEPKEDPLSVNFESLGRDISARQKGSIKNLLSELFPALNSVYYAFGYPEEQSLQLKKGKRIGSTDYFNRYFSYCVIKGEISDLSFEKFISDCSKLSVDQIVLSLNEFLDQSTPSRLLNKLQNSIDGIVWSSAKNLSTAICKTAEKFKEKSNPLVLLINDSLKETAKIVKRLIIKSENENKRFRFTHRLLDTCSYFDFTVKLTVELFKEDEKGKRLFSEKQAEQLERHLLQIAITDSKRLEVFEKFPDHSYYLLWIWNKIDKEECKTRFERIFKESPKKTLNLLISLLPNIHSSAVRGSFKGDFTNEHYKYIASIFDPDIILKSISTVFPIKEIKSADVLWDINNNQSDLNIVRQFKHWHTMAQNAVH